MGDEAAELIFDCEFKAFKNALMVRYTVRSLTPVDLGLFNRLQTVRLDGSLDFSPNNVYVDWEEPCLHLKKAILPIPEGLKMAERVVPYLSVVPPGATYEEEFLVTVPVPVNNPYRRALLAAKATGAEVKATERRAAREVAFSLGVIDPSAARKILDFRMIPVSPAYPGLYRPWPPGPAMDAQRLLTKRQTLDSPIQVLDYKTVSRE